MRGWGTALAPMGLTFALGEGREGRLLCWAPGSWGAKSLPEAPVGGPIQPGFPGLEHLMGRPYQYMPQVKVRYRALTAETLWEKCPKIDLGSGSQSPSVLQPGGSSPQAPGGSSPLAPEAAFVQGHTTGPLGPATHLLRLSSEPHRCPVVYRGQCDLGIRGSALGATHPRARNTSPGSG